MELIRCDKIEFALSHLLRKNPQYHLRRLLTTTLLVDPRGYVVSFTKPPPPIISGPQPENKGPFSLIFFVIFFHCSV